MDKSSQDILKINVYGFEMARVSEVYLSTLSRLMKPHGIERYFVALMHVCENNGHLTQKDLGLALRKDKVSTMRMVDYFAEKGMLKRITDKNDKRRQLLHATAKAQKLIPLILKSIQQTNEILLNDFNAIEKKAFKTCMDKLYLSMGNFPDPDFIIHAVKRKQP